MKKYVGFLKQIPLRLYYYFLLSIKRKHVYSSLLLFFSKFYLIFACTGSSLLCRLSLVVASGGYSLVTVHRLPTVVGSLVAEHGLKKLGFHCIIVHVGSVVVAPRLRCSKAHGVFQRLNLRPLHWQADS